MELEKLEKIERDVLLAPFTTYKIGGKADFFYRLRKKEDAMRVLQAAKRDQAPVLILGGGSNVLISDAGFRGLVLLNATSSLQISNTRVYVDAGVRLSLLVARSVEASLTGLEYLVGIPGTVGGAVAGNAGVPGWEIGDRIIEANIVSEEGEYRTVSRDYFHFRYRDSILRHRKDFLLSVVLQLQKGDRGKSKRLMKEIGLSRNAKQPLGKSCGSFFKNPSPDKPAGWLIDQCGLKGVQVGGAKVSERHANFLINTGNATYEDFVRLASHVKKMVFNKFNIGLKEEVRIIPETGA